jgi:hypothetical protein
MKTTPGILISVISVVASVTGSYFANVTTTNDKIAEAKSSFQQDISADRERLATVEEAVKNNKEILDDIRKYQMEILSKIR